jgi:hypothetical protein
MRIYAHVIHHPDARVSVDIRMTELLPFADRHRSQPLAAERAGLRPGRKTWGMLDNRAQARQAWYSARSPLPRRYPLLVYRSVPNRDDQLAIPRIAL